MTDTRQRRREKALIHVFWDSHESEVAREALALSFTPARGETPGLHISVSIHLRLGNRIPLHSF
jgi:hypothetical protein